MCLFTNFMEYSHLEAYSIYTMTVVWFFFPDVIYSKYDLFSALDVIY